MQVSFSKCQFSNGKQAKAPRTLPLRISAPLNPLSLNPFIFFLFSEYTREKFRLTAVIKSKALNQFEDFNVQNIRYRPEMKFLFHSVCFKKVLGHLHISKVHAHSSHSSNCQLSNFCQQFQEIRFGISTHRIIKRPVFTVSVSLLDWVAHRRLKGCQSPPLRQSLEIPTVSGCVPVPQSPMCSWRSQDIHTGIQGFLLSHLDCVVCDCSFEL